MTSEDQFRRLYAGNFEAVLAYALRRVSQPADAADVVAETFLDAMPPEIVTPERAAADKVLADSMAAGHLVSGSEESLGCK